jgi:ankyrin repeat protein
MSGRWLLVLWAAANLGAAGEARLIDAVKQGNRTAVRELLRTGAAVNAPGADGTTALHWAVRAGDVETAQLLLKAGADAKAANRYGVTPLSVAATNGDATMVGALLSAGADPNATLPEGETVLMTAARTGKAAPVKALLAHGALVNAREKWLSETALMAAAAENHPEVVTLLAEYGADLNARSTALVFPKYTYNSSTMNATPLPRGGLTALHLAARQDALEGARALIEAGADLNPTDPDGTSPLVMAIINRHNDVAALLVEKGADPNVADIVGMTALYAAVDLRTLGPLSNRATPKPTGRLDNLGLVKLLLDHGANPNARLKNPILARFRNAGDQLLNDGATPLMRASKGTDLPVMRALLDNGADPNLTTRNYTTALMLASGLRGTQRGGRGPGEPGNQTLDAVTLLLERGADVDAFNSAGLTPLHVAAERGEDEVVALLIERGADHVPDKLGRTALDLALKAPAAARTAARLRQLMGGAAKDVPAPR